MKKGICGKNFSRWLQEAFDLRRRADYREMYTVSQERANAVLDHAKAFVKEIKRQIGVSA